VSAANSFGSRFVVTSFGESHGTALGVVIDGVPAGVKWNEKLLLEELERRRPGQSKFVTARNETDRPEILSGVFEGKTLGTPVAIIVRNDDARSKDYAKIAKTPRAGHADDVWKEKFGHSDPRGGGRSSGRETVSRVMAGAIAKMAIASLAPKTKFTAFARAIGEFEVSDSDIKKLSSSKSKYPADEFSLRFPSAKDGAKAEKLLLDAKEKGLSYGGIVEIWIDGLPKSLGQPVFHKLKSDLAAAFMSVGATIGVEFGEGFASTKAEGSKFHRSKQDVYGGIRGGISTGERIVARIAFKPTSSVLDTAKKGRHDPCIVPRAVPVIEAMAAIVVVDHLLWMKTDRIG
jgi:chorismate synthase